MRSSWRADAGAPLRGRLACLLSAALLLAIAPGCPGSSGTGEPAPAAAQAQVPRRIVSLGPNVTEALFAVGAGARVVGATNHCDHPAAAREVEKVGDYGAPSLERIIALEPDLVVVPREGLNQALAERLASLGVSVHVFSAATTGEVADAIAALGEAVGAAEDGRAAARRVRDEIGSVSRRLAGRPPVATLVLLDRQDVIVAGPGTFLDEVVSLAGGRNVAGDAAVAWPRLTLETLLVRDPDVIVDIAMGAGDAPDRADPAGALRRAGFASVRAVAESRVVRLDPDLLTRAGPRIGEGVRALARALHPEAFEGE